MALKKQPSPRVFVAYLHDSPSYASRVLALADWLRAQGIDVILDQHVHGSPGEWPRWAEQQVAECDLILLVCTPASQDRLEHEDADSTDALLCELAQAHADKLILVLLEHGMAQDVPLVLRAHPTYRLPDAYARIFRRLTQQPETTPRAENESWSKKIAAAQSASGLEAQESKGGPWVHESRTDVGLDDHLWDTGRAAPLEVLGRRVSVTTRGSTIIAGGRVRHKQRPIPDCPDCHGSLEPVAIRVRFELAADATAVQEVPGYRCAACGSEWPEPSAMRAAHANAFGSPAARE